MVSNYPYKSIIRVAFAKQQIIIMKINRNGLMSFMVSLIMST